MIKHVLFSRKFFRLEIMFASVFLSNADVASSKNTKDGLLKNILAIAIL